MKALLLSLLTFSTLAAGGITTNFQGDVTFDDGVVISNADIGPVEPNQIFCDIGVQFSFRGSFQSIGGAQQFCRGFDDFCRTRRFSSTSYEANYRNRRVFRGRGNDHRGGRNNAFNQYFDFINQGRFHTKRFNHQFFFSDNCTSR